MEARLLHLVSEVLIPDLARLAVSYLGISLPHHDLYFYFTGDRVFTVCHKDHEPVTFVLDPRNPTLFELNRPHLGRCPVRFGCIFEYGRARGSGYYLCISHGNIAFSHIVLSHEDHLLLQPLFREKDA